MINALKQLPQRGKDQQLQQYFQKEYYKYRENARQLTIQILG